VERPSTGSDANFLLIGQVQSKRKLNQVTCSGKGVMA
jgi:hypothetical protein